ncbi:HEPN domain-containing protein [Halorussus halophilus]|uniref:hypothetical protein n=1 Tax=Halorussus halophilus TaxID=2650975 RepID=UPI001CE44200|nr:hypothetical protein [Halorussus halophilus]
MTTRIQSQIEAADDDLQDWLSTYAEAGVPELALVALLQTQAAQIERTGYIPRTHSLRQNDLDGGH